MKFWKKAGGVLLALALLIGLLPLSAAAVTTCEDGTHTPDLTTQYPANWNATTGGYGDDYYKCTTCGADCTARGYAMMFVDASNGCSGGKKCHVRGAAFATCSGTTGYYRCAHCDQIIDADGTLANISSLGGHTPDLNNLQLKNYTPCMGGYQSAYYLCTVCSQACDANGDGVVYTAGTGVHDPDLTTLHPADWNATTGGYGYDYYTCKDCGEPCDKNGQAILYVAAENGCSGGEKCHLPGTTLYPVDYDTCSGGYKQSYYRCTHCEQAVDAQGTIIKWSAGSHYPGTVLNDPNYTVCGGGIKTSYYECTICGQPCDANGDDVEWSEPTGKHTPGTEQYDPNYTPCSGGFTTSYYDCTVCGQSCDANGDDVQWSNPTTGKHTPGTELNDPNYTVCGGGVQTSYYDCTICGQPCDANGDDVGWNDPTGKHTPGTENDPNYTPCNGGFTTSYYVCTVCGDTCDANGDYVPWSAPTGKHTPGTELNNPNYTVCGGGVKTSYYECTVCGGGCDANGDEVQWSAPTAKHTPGTEQCDPNYTPCSGGVQTSYYDCTVCGQPCDANGDDVQVSDPTASHTLTKMDAVAPTYEADGNVEYWHCSVCEVNFFDAQGENPVEDMDDIILPKLQSTLQASITPGLSSVPESVAAQYSTVSDIQQALVSTALTANATLVSASANSVLLDVTLQRQNSDGTLTPVSAEDFPEEGVELLLPYPEGTDQTYTFVVTHMITAGEHTGEIEVLANTPEAGGIRVRFTSMSPVCITYQKKAVESGEDDGKQPDTDNTQKPVSDNIKKTSAAGKNQTGTTTTTTAVKTGDNADLLLWGALLALSGLALTCWLPKKKEQ